MNASDLLAVYQGPHGTELFLLSVLAVALAIVALFGALPSYDMGVTRRRRPVPRQDWHRTETLDAEIDRQVHRLQARPTTPRVFTAPATKGARAGYTDGHTAKVVFLNGRPRVS